LRYCSNATSLFDLENTPVSGLDRGWKTALVVISSVIGAVVIIALLYNYLGERRPTRAKRLDGMGQGGYPRSYGYDMNASRSMMY